MKGVVFFRERPVKRFEENKSAAFPPIAVNSHEQGLIHSRRCYASQVTVEKVRRECEGRVKD